MRSAKNSLVRAGSFLLETSDMVAPSVSTVELRNSSSASGLILKSILNSMGFLFMPLLKERCLFRLVSYWRRGYLSAVLFCRRRSGDCFNDTCNARNPFAIFYIQNLYSCNGTILSDCMYVK